MGNIYVFNAKLLTMALTNIEQLFVHSNFQHICIYKKHSLSYLPASICLGTTF